MNALFSIKYLMIREKIWKDRGNLQFKKVFAEVSIKMKL